MPDYPLEVIVEDTRSRSQRVQGLVESRTKDLRSEVSDYFGSHRGREEGDHLELKVDLSEGTIIRLLDFRLYRERADVRASGVFAGKAFRFYRRLRLDVNVEAGKRPPVETIPPVTEYPSVEEDVEHEEIFDGLVDVIIKGIDRATGRSWDAIGVRWRATSIVIWAFAALVFLFSLAFLVFWDPMPDASPGAVGRFLFFVALCPAVITYFVAYTIGAALMPIEFFDQHAAGRQVKQFVQRNDAAEARFALRVGVVVILVVVLFCAYVVCATFGYF